MTSLNDYLRAERPDRTEPVTFYRPGATSWSDYRTLRVPVTGGPDEELADPFNDPDEDDIADEVAAAQTAATLSKLEE